MVSSRVFSPQSFKLLTLLARDYASDPFLPDLVGLCKKFLSSPPMTQAFRQIALVVFEDVALPFPSDSKPWPALPDPDAGYC